MEKQIKLMPDHGCSPLWQYIDHELVDNPALDELPVTSDLVAALELWSAAYEGTCDIEDPRNSGFATPAEEAAFEAEGQRLCKELQAQLGPEYRVSYLRRRDIRSHDPETIPSGYQQEDVGSHSPEAVR